MTSLPLRDSESFRRGRVAEVLCAAVLRSKGHFVIPTYDYSGEDGARAPIMASDYCGVVLPDLMAAKRGQVAHFEIKLKARADFTYSTGRLEHGVGLRRWRDYLRVEQEFGSRLWLWICEPATGDILSCSRAELSKHARIYRGEKMDPGGMIFFPRSIFTLEAHCDDLALRGNAEIKAALSKLTYQLRLPGFRQEDK